jgi:hypothetical protein
MQIWNFIFLARSWASDRLYLTAQLSSLGKQAQVYDTPFTFILYPEGTLVSPNTRPISKKFAEKIGIVSLALSRLYLHQHHHLALLPHSQIWFTRYYHDQLGSITACVPWREGCQHSKLST